MTMPRECEKTITGILEDDQLFPSEAERAGENLELAASRPTRCRH